ncbi:Phosphatidylinositol 4-phosphate 5-kinase its3 [Schizosaccharomyces pombe]|uniref:Phosphatidylinositol 4-phosphate 5-kinase its3 n=1 Tax=Schizosaccharomyces pombe (strain 972 / ATCC 24843) TaxID=284812 RepID=ITS3_SCHPO|nr:1-phosphatidylinositol-4-phosphate 5-kinase Its3 [Schizosaccharomyces pombe]O13853.3 RecName: Full=Phosphatidylinositol 4-phosphate 5-kinase its3; AltName: Full=1-phosphatidylinositol 4-phosphate kinase; AltName: Full=Diphosphoinositide kinase; AltName: Full=PIP5K; AltName: Full=PtdIns(4)P-5-kinase [Schizosaccharomyces pombe 972h-]CAB10125.1 1-phosphatidylinositol-4-phosphate 5-kinase Its3 [Schizosaccharomyces pombe]|eukprot:NP_594429.1 1-phosphatidylinositol-4-phosphate 5-kinase Its3 [Schizosaccharomyces pombe]
MKIDSNGIVNPHSITNEIPSYDEKQAVDLNGNAFAPNGTFQKKDLISHKNDFERTMRHDVLHTNPKIEVRSETHIYEPNDSLFKENQDFPSNPTAHSPSSSSNDSVITATGVPDGILRDSPIVSALEPPSSNSSSSPQLQNLKHQLSSPQPSRAPIDRSSSNPVTSSQQPPNDRSTLSSSQKAKRPLKRSYSEKNSSNAEPSGSRSGDRGTNVSTSGSLLDGIPPDIGSASWAEAVKQKRVNMRRRREELDDECVLVGTRVSEGHENYVTAYNMLTGIRVGVSRCQAKMDRELTPADFTARHKFTFDITGNELTPSAKYDFKFKDYAPWVFRHLRQLFHLDAADYLVSLTSKYILSELDSPGKSGSFFYFSRDYRFIIKTIHHSEHKFLREILYDYYEHVKNNPNTLISQFYGLHRVKLPFGRKIHFVVMNNLFPPHRDIHQTFDLKGSTLGRELDENQPCQSPMCTMKDTNWIRRNMHLQFGPLKRQIFLTQVKADIDMLSSLGIMDYSLLVGIHDLSRGNRDKIRNSILSVYDPNVSQHRVPSINGNESHSNVHVIRQVVNSTGPVSLDQSCNLLPTDQFVERRNFMFYSDDGGFQATDENNEPGNFIFYIGIIDLLTKYSYVKRVEHLWKGINHSDSVISAVPPAEYASRFYKFVESSIKPTLLVLKPFPLKPQDGQRVNKQQSVNAGNVRTNNKHGSLNNNTAPSSRNAKSTSAHKSPKTEHRFPFPCRNVTTNTSSS